MASFITNPNQRQITIHKANGKKGYNKVNITANKAALVSLQPSAYKLYMYFNMNADNFRFIPSAVAIQADTGLSPNTYYAAFHSLKDQGYLVQRPGYKTLFDFYEEPVLQNLVERPTKNCESTSQKTAENILYINHEGDAPHSMINTNKDASAATHEARQAVTRRIPFIDM